MPLLTTLIENVTLEGAGECRLFPNWHGLDVRNYDRLHFHLGALPSKSAQSLTGIKIRVIFGTPVGDNLFMLAGSNVWFEGTGAERKFEYTVTDAHETGITLSVPVVAPTLFDVILENTGPARHERLYLSVMSQEI